MKVIGISGKIGSGKNYLAEHLEAELVRRGFTVGSASFAFPLKDQFNQMLDSIRAGKSDKQISNDFDIPLGEARTLTAFVRDELAGNPALNAYDRSVGVRSGLQYLGTEVRRAQDPDYWVKRFDENLDRSVDYTFATDVRFTNEADHVHSIFGYMIRLEVPSEIILDRTKNRDGIQYTAEQLNHKSETELDNYPDFDLVVGFEFEADRVANHILVNHA